MPELGVGKAAGPHKTEGLGFTTGFSQIAEVMDGHNSVAGHCFHVWFQVERESNKPGKSLGRGGGKEGSGVGLQEAGAFSVPWRAPAQYKLYHGGVRADQSSFPTPLAVTEALLPLCQLSGDTDRIFPREGALKQLI